jgi:uncharacterized membrane protein YfcA
MKALRLTTAKNFTLYFVLIYVALFFMLLGCFLFLWLPVGDNALKSYLSHYFDAKFFVWLAAGFVAQLIDGALGMAYGISSTTFLLTTGVSPAVASASVHLAEIFTTAVSGISHWRFGNVDKDLFKKLAIPGILGALLGASLVSHIDGNALKPFISLYLLIMGSVVLIKGIRNKVIEQKKVHIPTLGLVGGFADASGGGGWGPIVTTTLLSRGKAARTTIGTVNAAEFLVAVAASGVFTLFIGVTGWSIIIGLIAGGVLAAPLGAWMARKVSQRFLLITVGCVIIILSARNIFGF